MKKVFKIILLIVILLIFIIFSTKIKKQKDNGNRANMGLATGADGVIYYNKYEKGIFSVKNGEETQLTDETAYSLNVVKDKIYYLTVADFNNVMIKSVDKNGKNQKTIATIYTSISKIYTEDGSIYYATNQNNGGIAKIDLNGENESIVVEGNVQDFQLVEGNIFYINASNQICRVAKSGKSNHVLNDAIKASRIQVVDGWIYYYDDVENALFRLEKNGKKNQLISVLVKNEMYNVSGKYVYYFDSENQKIARMHIGKSNKCEDIVSLNIAKTKINLVDDEMYYLDKSQDESQTYQMYRIKVNGKEAKRIEY